MNCDGQHLWFVVFSKCKRITYYLEFCARLILSSYKKPCMIASTPAILHKFWMCSTMYFIGISCDSLKLKLIEFSRGLFILEKHYVIEMSLTFVICSMFNVYAVTSEFKHNFYTLENWNSNIFLNNKTKRKTSRNSIQTEKKNFFPLDNKQS